MGNLVTLLSSRVRWPCQPGSTKPAVAWTCRPSRASELLPSSRATKIVGQRDRLERVGQQDLERMHGERFAVGHLVRLHQLVDRLFHVDVRPVGIAEQEQLVTQVQVDAGRLDALPLQRLDGDAPRLDLAQNVAVAQDHARAPSPAASAPQGPGGAVALIHAVKVCPEYSNGAGGAPRQCAS